MSGPVLVLMLLCLPETSTPTILLHRACRLRKITGDERLLSQSEIDQKNIKPISFFVNSMVKPIEITIKDPAIFFVNIYTSLVYSIYYSFFEAFRPYAPRRRSSKLRDIITGKTLSEMKIYFRADNTPIAPRIKQQIVFYY